jgi:5'(3')-deoxyribonucleotidase
MNEKKILYIDMDGVLADFEHGKMKWLSTHPEHASFFAGNADFIHGIFRDLPLMEGALYGVYKLCESGKYDMFIASTAPWTNPAAAADKRYWIEKHFGNMFEKRMFITHRKDLLIGDYLIDDRLKNGAGEFKGELLHFGNGRAYPTWQSVLDKLL